MNYKAMQPCIVSIPVWSSLPSGDNRIVRIERGKMNKSSLFVPLGGHMRANSFSGARTKKYKLHDWSKLNKRTVLALLQKC